MSKRPSIGMHSLSVEQAGHSDNFLLYWYSAVVVARQVENRRFFSTRRTLAKNQWRKIEDFESV